MFTEPKEVRYRLVGWLGGQAPAGRHGTGSSIAPPQGTRAQTDLLGNGHLQFGTKTS